MLVWSALATTLVISLVVTSLVLSSKKKGKANNFKGNVIQSSKHYGGVQTFRYRLKTEVNIQDKTHPTKMMTSSGEFNVECYDLTTGDPRLLINSPEGILMDVINVLYVDDVCDKVGSYMVIDDPVFEHPDLPANKNGAMVLSITFALAGKTERCGKRTYKAVGIPYMAYSSREVFEFVDCPDSLKSTELQGETKPGVLGFGPPEVFHQMGYIKNLIREGASRTFIFGIDSRGMRFRLVCQTDTIKPDEKGQDTITTAKIYQQDDELIVLEKLVVNTCDEGAQGIHINGIYVNDKAIFKLVYRRVDSKCFSKIITRSKTRDLFYYRETYVARGVETRIRCPKAWTDDIGLHENLPWYKRKRFYKLKEFMKYTPKK